jgi:hypothetical protein
MSLFFSFQVEALEILTFPLPPTHLCTPPQKIYISLACDMNGCSNCILRPSYDSRILCLKGFSFLWFGFLGLPYATFTFYLLPPTSLAYISLKACKKMRSVLPPLPSPRTTCHYPFIPFIFTPCLLGALDYYDSLSSTDSFN